MYKDKPYYDSHCLNKDIPALIKQCQIRGIETSLTSKVNEIKLIKKYQTHQNNI